MASKHTRKQGNINEPSKNSARNRWEIATTRSISAQKKKNVLIRYQIKRFYYDK